MQLLLLMFCACMVTSDGELYQWGHEPIRRTNIDPRTEYVLIPSPDDAIPVDGTLTRLEFYCQGEAYTVSLEVVIFRPIASEGDQKIFTVVESQIIEVTDCTGKIVQEMVQMDFQQRDVLGLAFPNGNPIPYSVPSGGCGAVGTLYHVGYTMPNAGVSVHFTAQRQCRIFSLRGLFSYDGPIDMSTALPSTLDDGNEVGISLGGTIMVVIFVVVAVCMFGRQAASSLCRRVCDCLSDCHRSLGRCCENCGDSIKSMCVKREDPHDPPAAEVTVRMEQVTPAVTHTSITIATIGPIVSGQEHYPPSHIHLHRQRSSLSSEEDSEEESGEEEPYSAAAAAAPPPSYEEIVKKDKKKLRHDKREKGKTRGDEDHLPPYPGVGEPSHLNASAPPPDIEPPPSYTDIADYI